METIQVTPSCGPMKQWLISNWARMGKKWATFCVSLMKWALDHGFLAQKLVRTFEEHRKQKYFDFLPRYQKWWKHAKKAYQSRYMSILLIVNLPLNSSTFLTLLTLLMTHDTWTLLYQLYKECWITMNYTKSLKSHEAVELKSNIPLDTHLDTTALQYC